eukprot:COSAG02_NODE_42189_length_386_cov_50.222997_1_plen_58_part_10
MRCTAIACFTLYAQAVFALDNGLGALPCVHTIHQAAHILQSEWQPAQLSRVDLLCTVV